MKKLLLSTIAMFFALAVNAAEYDDIDISQGWGWGWNCETEYADGVATVTLTGNYGAFSTGWSDGADWSGYDRLCVDIESYSNDWGKVYFSDTEGNTVAEVSFGSISSHQTVTLNFDPEKATKVRQLGIQGKATGDVIKVSRVYLVKRLQYEEEGVEISFDEWGNIMASAFEGFSPDAKVVFTYTMEGELTNDDGSIVGWGIGNVKSIDGAITVQDIAATTLGDVSFTIILSDMAEALASGPNEYGLYGLNWNMYKQGNATPTRKSVVVYDVKETNYEEGVNINFDEWGNILAEEFEGFSPEAKVEFTYTMEGELTNDDGSIVGWGVGVVKSIDQLITVKEIVATKLGDVSFTILLKDMAEALASGPDEYGRYGLNWNMYKQGNATPTRKSVVVYDVKDDDNQQETVTTAIGEVNAEKADAAFYTLQGVRVAAPQKGVYIHNGKKVVLK